MKATDLEIYGWVAYKGKLCFVSEIDATTDKLTLEISKGEEKGKRLFNIPTSDVDPVPLTEEVQTLTKKQTDMILTCGDWFFNKMEKRTMQAELSDLSELWQNWIEPTPLLVGDLEKNGFVLEQAWLNPFFCRKLGAYDKDNKWIDIAHIEVLQDLTFVSVNISIGKGEFRGLGSLYNPKGLQVHELQQLLRLCGYADIADNFQL